MLNIIPAKKDHLRKVFSLFLETSFKVLLYPSAPASPSGNFLNRVS